MFVFGFVICGLEELLLEHKENFFVLLYLCGCKKLFFDKGTTGRYGRRHTTRARVGDDDAYCLMTNSTSIQVETRNQGSCHQRKLMFFFQIFRCVVLLFGHKTRIEGRKRKQDRQE